MLAPRSSFNRWSASWFGERAKKASLRWWLHRLPYVDELLNSAASGDNHGYSSVNCTQLRLVDIVLVAIGETGSAHGKSPER